MISSTFHPVGTDTRRNLSNVCASIGARLRVQMMMEQSTGLVILLKWSEQFRETGF
jgi:hypothetical protein